MQIILTEDVDHLGKRGQVVHVADGYGRNYLIPKGFAVVATSGNLRMIEDQRIARAKKEVRLKEEAEVLGGELKALHLVLSRKAGDTGVLFGSVTSKDLSELLEANGIHLDRRKIHLDHPLKQVGNFTVESRPHGEVKIDLLITVLAEKEEPVARVLKKGAESDEIVAQVEAHLLELQQAAEEGVAAEEPGEAFRDPASGEKSD